MADKGESGTARGSRPTRASETRERRRDSRDVGRRARGDGAGSERDARGPNASDALGTRALPFAMVITDPHLPDNPIIYVNKAFERMTGYSAASCIGRNCRFMQGERTSQRAVAKLRDGVASRKDVSVDLLNYRADGTPFMNRLLIAPLFGSNGEVTSMLGIQREIPMEAEREDDPEGDNLRAAAEGLRDEIADRPQDSLNALRERVTGHLNAVIELVRFDEIDPDLLPDAAPRMLGRRIEGLQLLYEELDQGGVARVHDDDVPLGAYLSRVCATLTHLEGRHSIRVNVDCDEVLMPVTAAARLGLLTTELLLNALRHAFDGRRDGLVNVEFKVLTGGRARVVVKDDGVGLTGDVDWPHASEDGARDAEDRRERRTGKRVGARLVRQMVDALDAEIDVVSGSFGTTVHVGLDLGQLLD